MKAINGLLGELYIQHNANEKLIYNNFNELLKKSTLKNDDWKVGGMLAGMSSESGVKKLKDLIYNKKKT